MIIGITEHCSLTPLSLSTIKYYKVYIINSIFSHSQIEQH